MRRRDALLIVVGLAVGWVLIALSVGASVEDIADHLRALGAVA